MGIIETEIRKKRTYNPIARKELYERRKNDPEFKRKSSQQYKNWRINNKDKVSKKNKNWRDKNKEKVLEIRKSNYIKRQENPLHFLHDKIRGLIKGSFKRKDVKYTKIKKSSNILGCTIENFRDYILSKCPEGTTLKEFNKFGYHLDHIIPISSAKNQEEVIELNHYTNFQPLWWSENLSKSNKIL